MNAYIKGLVVEEAVKAAPHEFCGFIVKKGDDSILVPARNVADNPMEHFVADSQDYLKATMIGDIIFVVHSHTDDNANFSAFDKDRSNKQQLPFMLYSIGAKKFNYYYPGNEVNPLIGCKFEIGVTDCFTLVQKYFKTKYDKKISEYIRGDNWEALNPAIIVNNYKSEGFKKVDNLRGDDILAFDIKGSGFPSHFGIFLGNGCFLHHPRHKESTIELLTKPWKEKIHSIYRVETS